LTRKLIAYRPLADNFACTNWELGFFLFFLRSDQVKFVCLFYNKSNSAFISSVEDCMGSVTANKLNNCFIADLL